MEAAAAPGFPPAAGLRNLRMPHFHLIRRRGPGPLGKGEKSPPTQDRAAAALGKHRGRSTPSSLLGEQLGGQQWGAPSCGAAPIPGSLSLAPSQGLRDPFPREGGHGPSPLPARGRMDGEMSAWGGPGAWVPRGPRRWVGPFPLNAWGFWVSFGCDGS